MIALAAPAPTSPLQHIAASGILRPESPSIERAKLAMQAAPPRTSSHPNPLGASLHHAGSPDLSRLPFPSPPLPSSLSCTLYPWFCPHRTNRESRKMLRSFSPSLPPWVKASWLIGLAAVIVRVWGDGDISSLPSAHPLTRHALAPLRPRTLQHSCFALRHPPPSTPHPPAHHVRVLVRSFRLVRLHSEAGARAGGSAGRCEPKRRAAPQNIALPLCSRPLLHLGALGFCMSSLRDLTLGMATACRSAWGGEAMRAQEGRSRDVHPRRVRTRLTARYQEGDEGLDKYTCRIQSCACGTCGYFHCCRASRGIKRPREKKSPL